MNRKLRGLVESIVLEILSEEDGMGDDWKVVNFEGYKGYDLEARCNHCNADLWLVWRASDPGHRWTECGGIGEGSCHARLGYDPESDPDSANVEPPPATLRSPRRDGESTKLKRSI